MPRQSTGQVTIRERQQGQVFALRFRAYGKRQYITLGTAKDGWNRQSEEERLAEDVKRYQKAGNVEAMLFAAARLKQIRQTPEWLQESPSDSGPQDYFIGRGYPMRLPDTLESVERPPEFEPPWPEPDK